MPYAAPRKVSPRDRSGSFCLEHLAHVAPCIMLCRVQSDLWRLSVGDRLFLAGSFALVSLQRYSFQMARRTRRGTAFVGSESSVIQRRNPSGTPLLLLLTPRSLPVPVQDWQSIFQDYVQFCKSTGGTHPGPRISIDHALPKTRGLVLPMVAMFASTSSNLRAAVAMEMRCRRFQQISLCWWYIAALPPFLITFGG